MLNLDELGKKYESLLAQLKKPGCFDLELSLLCPRIDYKVKRFEKDSFSFTSKNSADAFNLLQKVGIYNVLIEKNDVSIKYKDENLDSIKKRLDILASAVKVSFSSELRAIQSTFDLKGKKKDKLSDEEKHQFSLFQKNVSKATDAFNASLKKFEKFTK